MLPVDEVAAHGVAPVHIAPFRAVGVILEIEMVFAVFVGQAIGVVHPSVEGRVVVNGAIVVGVGDVPRVAETHLLQRQSVFRQIGDSDHGLVAFAEGERHFIVHVVDGEAHVHPSVGFLSLVEHHLCFGHFFLNGENEIFRGIGDGDDGRVAAGGDVHVLGGEVGGGQSGGHDGYISFHD